MGEWRYRSAILELETRVANTHWIGGWVGPKAGPVAVEKRRILHCRILNPGHPACSPSLYRQLKYHMLK
jgi:hypothetical protein